MSDSLSAGVVKVFCRLWHLLYFSEDDKIHCLKENGVDADARANIQ